MITLYLVIFDGLVGQEFLLCQDHVETGQEHDEAVRKVSKHDSKQERKCDDAERGWNVETS